MGLPLFAFLHATTTPHSKSTLTRVSHDTCSTGNVETTFPVSSPSGSSPVLAAPPSSSAPSPQEHVHGMPMPPHHPTTGTSGRQHAGSVPISLTPVGSLMATSPQQQAFEEYCQHLHTSVVGSEPVPKPDREDDRPSCSGQPSPDGLLKAGEREDSIGLLSSPSSQPSPRASLPCSCNGSAALLARIGSAFRSCSHSQHTSSRSGGTGTGSGASSRHNSHVSLSNVLLALGCACAESLIHSIGSTSWSSIELVLGRTSGSGPGAIWLSGGGESSDASEGSSTPSSNPESHTFGVPIIGGAGTTALPRHGGGARAPTLVSDPGWSSTLSVSAGAVAIAV
jgi:hypothetical protein